VKQKIVIVGAGPAGSSLAIRLAKKDFAVTLIEREQFPRHKLCGEFISPECLDHFASLGVLEKMTALGGDRVDKTIFYAQSGRSVTVPSSWFGAESALCLSRSEMDLQLLQHAKSLGVLVYESTSATGLLMDKGRIAGVAARAVSGDPIRVDADIAVDATGRAAALSRLLAKTDLHAPHLTPVKPAFIGFKAHMKNASLERSRCEIYVFRGGYGGLTHVEGGVSNFCFLVRADLVREFKSDAGKILNEIVMQNRRARITLADAEAVTDWLAVSISGFGRKELAPAPGLFAAGDAAAFIDPFTGSGMLIAFESAELLARSITGHPGSAIDMARQYKREYSSRFAGRLRTAALLRRAAFVPLLAAAAIGIAGGSSTIAGTLARFTRGRSHSKFLER